MCGEVKKVKRRGLKRFVLTAVIALLCILGFACSRAPDPLDSAALPEAGLVSAAPYDGTENPAATPVFYFLIAVIAAVGLTAGATLVYSVRGKQKE